MFRSEKVYIFSSLAVKPFIHLPHHLVSQSPSHFILSSSHLVSPSPRLPVIQSPSLPFFQSPSHLVSSSPRLLVTQSPPLLVLTIRKQLCMSRYFCLFAVFLMKLYALAKEILPGTSPSPMKFFILFQVLIIIWFL